MVNVNKKSYILLSLKNNKITPIYSQKNLLLPLQLKNSSYQFNASTTYQHIHSQ